MMDFSKIHSFQFGQRASFEELVCQLARREIFPVGSEFRRVEGAGGDGGVEAYWKGPNGKKTGYQAKYFLRSGDIDWAQIDKSVSQAIETHKELESYIVAIPCDLTDRAGKKGRGQTGWDHWTSRVAKWTDQRKKAGNPSIRFVPWTQSELLARLSRPGSEGLREYWFGEVELSSKWFADNISEAVASLDERYHPEDHVDVRIQELFSVISRDDGFISKLNSALSKIEKCALPSRSLSGLSNNPDPKLVAKVASAHSALIQIRHQFFLPLSEDWPTNQWIKLVDDLSSAIAKLSEWYWDYEFKLAKDSNEKYKLRDRAEDADNLSYSVSEFRDIVSSHLMRAENKRFAIVTGIAGTGKSHLLGEVASRAVGKGSPALLVLGQRLNDEEPWSQFAKHVHLPGRPSDQILGALDAAGEAVGVRVLVLIDAINEGPGSRYWRNHLQSLEKKISQYKNIAFVVSCRSEYLKIAVPERIAVESEVFEIRGFETAEEQLNAARAYLDRRGIARPSTPWLAPEFVNPLFLRSVSVALERDRRSEFPAGLTGTRKILDYYLESAGRNITFAEGSIVPLDRNLKSSLLSIARQMVARRQDFLTLDEAGEVVAECFKSKNPTTASDWLSVLLGNGLLRRDPNPVSNDQQLDDEDVVRFSFQRFQDFLMADALLSPVEKSVGLFDAGGALEFCLDRDQLAWQWRGVVEALASILPEKLGIELVDALPGGFDRWWDNWGIHETFAESVKWRDRTAFTDRSLELLNSLHLESPHSLDLILQVVVSSDHPWNAELLHRNLLRRKLPDRDVFWTVWLNDQSDDENSTVGTLIEWCLTGQAPNTKAENQFLAGLTLCWFYTSSNRSIRDKATKALSALLVANRDLFPKLLDRFQDVDDLYVLERLLAAAFGACCQDPSPLRLETYSKAVFCHVFSTGSPPLGLLLRDYAFGIVELAKFHATLSAEVDFDICQPPYVSKKMRFAVSDDGLKQVAEKSGGEEILRSAAGAMGDFANYEIKSRIRHFLSVPLAKQALLTKEQQLRAFEDAVIGSDKKKIQAFEALRKNANPYSYGLLSTPWNSRKKASKREIKDWQKAVALSEAALLELLSESEVERFRTEAALATLDHSGPDKRAPEVDLPAARRWVAKRAYDFGWTHERFGTDRSKNGGYSRDRPLVERIGKKYQWLALDELTCRLADNNWLAGEYGHLPRAYASPVDVGFDRDIDPTILERKQNPDRSGRDRNSWAIEPVIVLEDLPEEQLPVWPFRRDPAAYLQAMPYRTDEHGVRWVVLYEHQSMTERYVGERLGEHGTRQQEFRFLASVIVRKAEAEEILLMIRERQEIDMHHWGAFDVTDSAFLFEAPWRRTWPADKWRYDNWHAPDGVGVATPVAGYQWESHLDASLPEGYRTHLPASWLAKELSLRPTRQSPGEWINSSDEVVFKELVGEEGGVVCLFREDELNLILGEDLCVFSLMIAERNSWPGGSNDNAAWRRSEGVCWHDGKKMTVSTWKRDNGNGSSARLVNRA